MVRVLSFSLVWLNHRDEMALLNCCVELQDDFAELMDEGHECDEEPFLHLRQDDRPDACIRHDHLQRLRRDQAKIETQIMRYLMYVDKCEELTRIGVTADIAVSEGLVKNLTLAEVQHALSQRLRRAKDRWRVLSLQCDRVVLGEPYDIYASY